ncbi:MAG TPA: hypothetical protein VFR58_10960 [Flavisolibacter sp.]|nr:hypothetical protein [Flavisolibacter sp.]
MKAFILELKQRSEPLFYFGILCLAASLICLSLTRFTATQVAGVNTWFKPFKFALSIAVYSMTMAWLVWYLPQFNRPLFSWTIILLLGFEIVYIILQAARGRQSHFNVSTSSYAFLYAMMAIAATAVAVYTAYIGVLFFTSDFPQLPSYYLWAIRLGILLFVAFSLEGFVMGSRLSHTIGAADGGPGLPIVNWSTKYGDPRIAHFIGMHALQVLPLASWYLLKDVKATILLGLLYGLLAIFTLIQALHGKPFYKF